MIRKLVIVFVGFISLQIYSQQGTASPYSFYGIGSLKFKGTVENRSMGGLSIYTDSIHVNLRNPASYGGKNLEFYGGETRPVKFTVGGNYSSINLKTENNSGQTSATSFNYVALSIPLGKMGFGFGLLPYTAVGYKLELLNGNGDIQNRFAGEGGLNKAFLGFGYQISDGFSAGIDFQYNFGNIKNSAIEFLYDGNNLPLQYQTRENNRSDLSGLNVNLGLIYKKMLNEKLEVVSGITYSPKSNLISQNKRSYSTISVTSSGNEIVVDQEDKDLEELGLKKTNLSLPSKLSFGIGIGQLRKWFFGAEYLTINTSEFSNPLYDSTDIVYENGSTFSLGGFYIPQYNAFNGYFKRMVYRTGLRFEKTGINIENQSIKEFGISFGVGLPVGELSSFSNANLGFEIGQRGTTSSNLIQENFINVQLSLSLNDRWFVKRKYD